MFESDAATGNDAAAGTSGTGADGGGASGTTPADDGGGAAEGGPAPGGSAGAPFDASRDPCAFGWLRRVDVSSSSELLAALAAAEPGDLIALSDARYPGNYGLSTSGTEAQPIVICGSRRAVLDGADPASGYVLHLEASYVVISGLSLTNAQKGIVIDSGNHNRLTGIELFGIGMEAVHFRTNSSFNVIEHSLIHDTGLTRPGFGEAVYIGSAVSNWPTYTNGEPDRSDNNQVLDNTLGPNVRGELVDIKEGTAGGVVSRNVFDGAGMNNENFDDSWVDVKGSGYTLSDNVGTNALLDGFQVHVVSGDPSSGQSNIFERNRATVTATDGYAFRIPSSAAGNVVRCDNQATPPSRLANVSCAP